MLPQTHLRIVMEAQRVDLSDEATPGLMLLGQLAVSCLMLLGPSSNADGSQRGEDARDLLAGLLQLGVLQPHTEASLLAYQQQQGFSHRLDTGDLRRLHLLLHRAALQAALASMDEAPQPLLQELEAVSRQLCAEQPDCPACAYHLVLALDHAGKPVAAAKACCALLCLAHARNGEQA